MRSMGSEGAGVCRLFVAIVLPESVRAVIATTQADLKRALSDANIRWIPPESLHLTLTFIGDVAVTRLEPLAEALRTALRNERPLPLRIAGLGVFPDTRFPRIVWAGVVDARGALAHVQRCVEEASRPFVPGKSMEAFFAHVTIGRITHARRRQAEVLAAQMSRLQARAFGDWTAYDVRLFRSELLPSGARHSCVACVPLGAANEAAPSRLPEH